MLQIQERSTGTRYSILVTLLLIAYVYTPLVLLATRPVGYASLSLAFAFGILCTALGWFEWRKRSDLSILSVVPAVAHSRAE